MSSVIHGTFTVTADLTAPPERVFAAYAEHVVFSYHLTVDDVRRWASLVTIELVPADGGTRLRHTEHYVFLAFTADGAHDTAHLEGGTRLQLNGLAAALGTPG